jgi:large subunit ribosomal protein L19
MQSVIQKLEEKYKKHQVVDVRSGDTVKVHQKIREGNKERVQIFQGLVIRVDRKGSHRLALLSVVLPVALASKKAFYFTAPWLLKSRSQSEAKCAAII